MKHLWQVHKLFIVSLSHCYAPLCSQWHNCSSWPRQEGGIWSKHLRENMSDTQDNVGTWTKTHKGIPTKIQAAGTLTHIAADYTPDIKSVFRPVYTLCSESSPLQNYCHRCNVMKSQLRGSAEGFYFEKMDKETRGRDREKREKGRLK